jgi:very-short-patch-repair endonuclease
MTHPNHSLARALRAVLEYEGLPVGTHLENRVTWQLHKWKVPEYKWQYCVGPYRLDYAWPAQRIALEVDGPHHWRPDVAVKDVARDAYLRARGWLVFRVDDTEGKLAAQLFRFAMAVGVIGSYDPIDDVSDNEDRRDERRILRRAETIGLNTEHPADQ